MAHFPDDVPPLPRRSALPLRPFVAPKAGQVAVRRTPPRTGAQQGGPAKPARLYTPPCAVTPRPVPPAPFAAPDASPRTPSEAAEDVIPAITPDVAGHSLPTAAAASAASAAPEVSLPAQPAAAPYDNGTAASWADDYFEHAPSRPEVSTEGQHDAEEADDDWFADEESESQAVTVEASKLTPAFNELTGIERLATTAPAEGEWDAPALDGPPPLPKATEEPAVPVEQDPRAAIAEALERVALRVREGSIMLPSDVAATSSEAAVLAAVLTALLRAPSR